MKLCVFLSYGTGFETLKKAGGLKRQLKIFKEYQKSFDEVLIISYDAEHIKTPFEVLIRKRTPIAHSLFSPFTYWKKVRSCDVIFTTQMVGAWAPVIASLIARKPLVVRQGYSWSEFEKKANNKFKFIIARITEFFALLKAKQVIVTAKDQKESLGKINITKTPIHIVPNGVDTELFKPDRKPQKNSLLFVGRLTEQKNLFNMISAVSRTSYSLTIVGEGPLKKELEEHAKGEKVTFLGRVSNEELPELMNKHEGFLFATLYEGNPKALLEAMSAEIPIITSKVPGNYPLSKNRGIICDTNEESIKRGIDKLEEMKYRNREFILKNFDLKKNSRKEAKILEKSV